MEVVNVAREDNYLRLVVVFVVVCYCTARLDEVQVLE